MAVETAAAAELRAMAAGARVDMLATAALECIRARATRERAAAAAAAVVAETITARAAAA
jgi:hypothetical protein